MQLLFGIGALWGTRTDVSNIGPDQFAILQNNEIDFSFELKELYGQLQFPVDIARGKGKITGKAKMARVFGSLYADLFFGATITTGETNVAEDELDIVPAATPFNVTVANSGTFVADLGLYYASGVNAGKRFAFASASPTASGSYSVSGGVYTFFSGDASQALFISYVFTDAAGKQIQLTNNFMGYTPTFVGTFYQQRNTQGSSGQLTLRLNVCVSNHLTLPSRLDDYAIPDFDFQALSNQSKSIGTLSTTE